MSNIIDGYVADVMKGKINISTPIPITANDVVEISNKMKNNKPNESIADELKVYVRNYLASVDVVEVVRCKDCKRYIEPYCTRFLTGIIPVTENDFCSFGERKESKIKRCFDIPKEVAERLLEDTERKEMDELL